LVKNRIIGDVRTGIDWLDRYTVIFPSIVGNVFCVQTNSNCTSSTFPYKISTQPNNETLIYLSRRKQANSASLLNSFSRISPFHLEKAIPTLTRVFCNLRLRVRIRSILDILGNEDSFSFGSAYVWSSITNNSAMQSFKLAGANASHLSAPPFCCFSYVTLALN